MSHFRHICRVVMLLLALLFAVAETFHSLLDGQCGPDNVCRVVLAAMDDAEECSSGSLVASQEMVLQADMHCPFCAGLLQCPVPMVAKELPLFRETASNLYPTPVCPLFGQTATRLPSPRAPPSC